MKIVFVHGMNANAQSWNQIEGHEALDDWTPKAVTLIGHDERAIPEDLDLDLNDANDCRRFKKLLRAPASSTAGMASYIDSVEDAFPTTTESEPRDICLVGHSMGGAVISHLAADPELRGRIGRLVYVAAMIPDDGETILRLNARFALSCALDPCSEFAPYMPQIADGLTKQPLIPLFSEFVRDDNFNSIPKTYITCKDDRIICVEEQERMFSRYSMDILEMPTGHLPQYQDQDLLAELIAATLSS